MKPFFVHAECSDSVSDYVVGGPERHLYEILSFSYEAALEAGLPPKKAFSVIENWLVDEQLQSENLTMIPRFVLPPPS
jgi:hypothetical protein